MYNNRDWSSGYLYQTMHYKISDIMKCIDKYGCHLHKDRDVWLMKIALHHLDCIIDEFKSTEQLDKLFKEKYGECKMMSKEVDINGEKMYEHTGFSYSKCNTSVTNDYANKVWSRINRIRVYRNQIHHKKFWYIMEKYSETWWD
jgi:hypothetical protein